MQSTLVLEKVCYNILNPCVDSISSAKQQAIQNIISNLHISTLEYRDENDPDVSPYVHNRKIELLEVLLIPIYVIKFIVEISALTKLILPLPYF